MFADPQTVTISAVAQTLARTGVSLTSGTFLKADSLVGLQVGQAAGKRNRRSLRLNHRKIAADPFDSSLNAEYSMSVYLVVDVPKVGYTVAEAQAVVDGFVDYLDAASGAKITQLLGGEL
jgi:urease gamma subunit